jgi:hypothetical protein
MIEMESLHNDFGGFDKETDVGFLPNCDVAVDLRSSKVCGIGLLNVKAQHVFYPFERDKFRCRYDYYWASVFKVVSYFTAIFCLLFFKLEQFTNSIVYRIHR